MRYKLFLLTSFVGAAAFIIGGCGGGIDQGSEQGPDDGPEPVSVTVFTEKVELFMEYPRLVRGREARFLAHVTVLATGEPVRSGTLTLEATGPDSTPVTLRVERPVREGLFIPAGSFKNPGMYDARIVVESEQVNDTIQLDGLAVYADEEAAHAAAHAAKEGPADAIPFLLEQQWKIRMLTEPARRRTLVNRLQVPGHIAATGGGTAVVSPPVSGRLVPAPSGQLPRIGQHVEAGQVLAYIEPPLPVTEAAQLAANRGWIKTLEMELLMRQLDLETKLLEVELALPQAKARLEFSQRTFERLAKLREKGLSTERQHDEAERDLRVAEVEYQGALALKQSYERVAWHLDQLRTLAPSSEIMAAADNPGVHLLLVAPISGEIVSVEHVEGEHVEANGEVYRIVNTDRVWLVADVSEFDLAAVGDDFGAVMTLLAYPGKRFDVLGAAGGRLINVGRLVDPSSRTIAIRYELPNPAGLFRVGMFADVYLETQQATDATAIPEQAVVMDNGRPIAFVLLGGESFQRRELTLGVRDGGYVEIVDGIEVGERVVTTGAYAVKLASQAPEAFGHGHAH